METYDRQMHILLRDQAHQRCIHQDEEYEQYVQQVRDAGFDVFTVECPEWPPVKRTPLPIIIFSISVDGSGGGGTGMGGPTADMTWEGEQLGGVVRPVRGSHVRRPGYRAQAQRPRP